LDAGSPDRFACVHCRNELRSDSGARWKAAIAFDVLVPVAIGVALVIFLILIFATSSTRSSS